LSIVALICAYQAARTVAAVVRATREYTGDVIVVDDGSTDRTAEAARVAGAQVIRFPVNRGKGAALRAGFAAILDGDATAVVTLDADGQHDPREIPRLLECRRQTHAGLVIGSRTHLEAYMTPVRRFGNRFSRGAISLFAGVSVPDGQSGFRLYDAALLRTIPLRGARYEMESEVIVKAARMGFAVASVPVRLADVDGSVTSHYRPWRDTARICVAVVGSRFWSVGCS
jgi:glycosyltransferase involved in cell wall biosynthesis